MDMEQAQEQQARKQQARAFLNQKREDKNAYYKVHGYRWKKSNDGKWQLHSHDNRIVTEVQALSEIYVANKPRILGVQSWAKDLMNHQPLFLDTETTGFQEPDTEVIELAVVDVTGKVLIDTLIQCKDEIPPDATCKNGISNGMLKDAPIFSEVWEQLYTLLASRVFIIFNAEYDLYVLSHTAQRYLLSFPLNLQAHCLMLKYSEYIGERKYGDYTYQRLEHACTKFDIEPGGHRALADAETSRRVFLKLASLKVE